MNEWVHQTWVLTADVKEESDINNFARRQAYLVPGDRRATRSDV